VGSSLLPRMPPHFSVDHLDEFGMISEPPVVSVTCGGSGGVTAQVVFEIVQGTESTSPGKKFMLYRGSTLAAAPTRWSTAMTP
jgi:hypothetical protein